MRMSMRSKGGALALRWTEDGRERRLPLPEGVLIRLGRGEDCDAVFAHQTVSRLHAEIYWRDGRLYLRHLSRRSPTWLGGRLVLAETLLKAGDRIHLAIVAIEVIATEAVIDIEEE
jgi:pSer/pThr/pTyr-binding forkhead associated (FHA) protein